MASHGDQTASVLSPSSSAAVSATSSRLNNNGSPVGPIRQDSQGSGSWSTAATPGLVDEDEVDGLLPGVPTGLPLTSAATSSSSPQAKGRRESSSTVRPIVTRPSRDSLGDEEKKNVRFAGPDGAPLSPADTFVSTDSYVAPQGPPPTVIMGDNESADSVDQSKQQQQQHALHSGQASKLPATSPASPPPPSPLKSLPAPTSTSSAPPVKPSNPTPPSAPPSSLLEERGPAQQLDSKQIGTCQKHCKWAISALDYEDLDTARAELRKALMMLGG